MRERVAPPATVPDVVGLPFHVGRDVAQAARVALANPDPDGPPIASLAWPGLFFIVQQDPAPGTVVHAWDSVTIGVVRLGEAPQGAPAPHRPVPPSDSTAATAEHDVFVDLTDDPA